MINLTVPLLNFMVMSMIKDRLQRPHLFNSHFTVTPLPIPVDRPTVPPMTQPTAPPHRPEVIIGNTPNPTTRRSRDGVQTTLKPKQSWTANVLQGDADIRIYNNVSTHLPASTIGEFVDLVYM